MNKLLSKLPDHFDIAKTGDKIQKGYWFLYTLCWLKVFVDKYRFVIYIALCFKLDSYIL